MTITKTPSSDGLGAQLAYLTRVLKTPTIAACWEQLADQAREANWSHEEYLAALLSRQVADREAAGTTMRIRTAHFPAVKTLEDFNLDHLPSLRRDVLAHLATGTFIPKAENVVLLGPPGIGKTHLAIGLGVKAAQTGHSVLFDTASNWIARLGAAHHAGALEAELKKIRRYRLIIVDEVGYIPFDQDAANLFFQLVASRYEQASIMVTSNLPVRTLGRDLLRRRRRRGDDRPAGPPRRSPHPLRRLLPHPRPPRPPRQRPQPRRLTEPRVVKIQSSGTGQSSAAVDTPDQPNCADSGRDLPGAVFAGAGGRILISASARLDALVRSILATPPGGGDRGETGRRRWSCPPAVDIPAGCSWVVVSTFSPPQAYRIQPTATTPSTLIRR